MDLAEIIDISNAENHDEINLTGVPAKLRAPSSWRVTEDGIDMYNQKTGDWDRVCRTPLLLSRRMKHVDTGNEKMEIAFLRDGAWQTAIIERPVLFQSRTIPELASLGITVISENARPLVKYLGELEAENIDVLKTSRCVSRMGWCGKNFIPGDRGDIVIDTERSMQKWVNAYSKEGSIEEWIDKIGPFRDNHIFRFILACAFAAPLLRVLNHRVFLVHNW